MKKPKQKKTMSIPEARIEQIKPVREGRPIVNTPDGSPAIGRDAVWKTLLYKTSEKAVPSERINLPEDGLRALELFTNDITPLTRESKNEGPMRVFGHQYVEAFNNSFPESRLAFYQDTTGNILMTMNATLGYENKKGVLFQDHTDMVCEAESEVSNPRDAGVTPVLFELADGDIGLGADRTTAGTDNGLGLTAGLAMLEKVAREKIPHPKLGVLLTWGEEDGLLGAKTLDLPKEALSGFGYMLNLDNERTYAIVGAAGMEVNRLNLPLDRQASDMQQIQFTMDKFKGGHSGIDIHEGRINAIALTTHVLNELKEKYPELKLVSLTGGTRDNAIPAKIQEVTIAVPNDIDRSDIEAFIMERVNTLTEDSNKTKDKENKEHPTVGFRIPDGQQDPFTEASTQKALALLRQLSDPQGELKIEWSEADPTAVETSSNLAIVRTTDSGLALMISSRSSVDSKLHGPVSRPERIANLAKEFNGTSEFAPDNSFIPWEPNFDQLLNKLVMDTANQVYDPAEKFRITTIHAGLECGILSEKFEAITGEVPEIVSIGPVILGAHSTTEVTSMRSFAKFFQHLELLTDRLLNSDEKESSRRGQLAA